MSDLAERIAEKTPSVEVATKKPETTLDKIRSDRFLAEVNNALPEHIDGETFIRHALTLIKQNRDLLTIAASKDPSSIFNGILRAANLGLDLDPTLGQAWLVPRRVNGTLTAVFQVGYRGFLELAFRSGQIRRIEVERVCERDTFDAEKGARSTVRFIRNWFGDRGKQIGWYALIELTDGGIQFVTIGLAEMEEHRDLYAPKKDGKVTGPWANHFEAMGDKTALLKVLRWAPRSVNLDRELSNDDDARAFMEVTADEDVIDVDAETGEIIAAAEVVG